jgi:hypothetical protein
MAAEEIRQVGHRLVRRWGRTFLVSDDEPVRWPDGLGPAVVAL